MGSEEKQDKKPEKEEEQQDEAEEVQKPFLENNNQRYVYVYLSCPVASN